MLEKIALKIVKIDKKITAVNRKIAGIFARGIMKYNDRVLQEDIYSKFRKSTAPFHWSWINKWVANLFKDTEAWPFTKPGLYICVGEPGAGKSSLMAEIAHRMYLKTGKGSYINTAMEKPRTCDLTGRRYVLHPRYDISDFFWDRKIVLWPNQYLYCALHVDEAHIVWNPRENNSNFYNNTFIPFMRYAVGVRHYIGHMFMYTQMDKVDTQANQLGQENMFTVQVKKGFDYPHWLDTGEFRYTILGWDIDFFYFTGGGDKNIYKSVYIERTFNLDYFDTYNLREELKNAKMDNRFSIERFIENDFKV